MKRKDGRDLPSLCWYRLRFLLLVFRLSLRLSAPPCRGSLYSMVLVLVFVLMMLSMSVLMFVVVLILLLVLLVLVREMKKCNTRHALSCTTDL